MKTFIKNSLYAFMALSLMACATRGQNFSSDYSWIKEGQTTKADLIRVLGEPYHVGYSGGKPTWTYGFYKFSAFGASTTKELKIYWNNTKVDSFSFNSSFPEDKRKALAN